MKNTFLLAAALAAANAGATGASALKPVMWADVPDVAPLRVGDTYYMVSTTMHFNPGVPVMASKDLVNWKTISYCYKTVEDRPQDRLENGASDYGLGTWASSIRYNENDGFFYVTSFNNKVNSTYLFRSKDPTKSDWEFFRLSPKQYDESLWIEDGRFYVFATVPGRPYKVRMTEMKPDFSGFVDGGRIILDNVTDCAGGGGLGEGTQVFKRSGWCYIVNIGWPKGSCRCVIVHRARSWDGPWEGRIVFAREGIAQGSFIDRPDGSWVAVLFGDRGAVGRIPYILETEWKDDWPVVQPCEVKDASGSTGAKVPGCVASDEFDGGELGLQWQWNHNPDDANWSLSERRGFMRIKAGRVDGDLLQARNTLTQRTFGPACEGETCIDVSGLKEGDVAGLTLLQKLYGLAAVRVRGGKKELVLWSPDVVPTRDKQNVRIDRAVRERQKVALPDGATKVWLKAVCDFTPGENLNYTGIPASTDKGKFYYSFDGRGWTPFGDAFDLVYTIPHFIGYRFGLCCFSTSAEGVGGFADFDYMRVSPRDDAPFTLDGSNPIVKTRFSPDPAAVVDGDWLYVFSGHDEPDARGYTMRDWGVVRTKDMKNWEDLGPVMTPAVFKWALGNNRAWASQAIKRNGKWYWYVAVYGLDPRGDCIGVAVADRPEGPWSDPIGKPLVGPGAGYIDPSVFIDDDGKAYLFWGNCGGTPGCWYAELKENMVEFASEVKPVPGLMEESAFGKPLKKARGAGARKPIDTNFEEAPWIYKLGDTYYLEYAAGGVPEYWAYSTAKSIHGPWKYGGKVMDCAEGTGTIHGGSVFFKGEWYMLYHNATLEGGADCRRSACIERYVRNPDGSIPFIPATKKGVAAPAPSVNVVTVDPSAVVGEASPDLWGLFFEDIDLSLDGGVYAEMVRNRSFEDGNGRRGELTLQYWNPVGSAECFLSDKPGAHANDRHCMTVRGRSGAGAANEGYFGMGVKKGASYNLSVALRVGDGSAAKSAKIDVVLEAYGKAPLATARIEGVTDEWRTFDATLVANDDEAQARLLFRIVDDGAQLSTFQIDHVSLFPADAVAGLFRRDLVEKLAALKPSFMRFPGGCWVEGETMRDAYRWKTTIGDKWNRRTQWNIWKYWSTNGVGFHEYLLLSEALGAKPLFCINCGMSHKETVPMDKMDEFVQDALDCIEYANGPTNSVWGAKRAAAGHPEPFGLKYLEIGNENGGKDYEARYALIAKAVREKYPEIQLVFNNWKSTKRVDDPKDLRDDHFYDSPDRFMSSLAHEYDEPKGDFGIFVGEYAVTTYTHRYGSLRGAIGEAAFMLGIERNQSQVKLAAYAPLFANAQHTAWTPNMIYPTTTGSFSSPSWNVQKLFSENRGREVLKVSVETGTYETDTNFAWGKGVNHNVIENVQASAMRDAAGDIILKLVNCTEKAQQVEIRGVAGSGTRTVFTGPDRLAHNSPAEPEALKETSAPFKLEGTDTLPPLSLVIYRLR